MAYPFITFYTPTYRRPTLLEQCRQSIRDQDLGEWEHIVIPDDIGIGVKGVFEAVPKNTHLIRGEYVYFLQDDDILTDPHVVRDLKAAALESNFAPVIMVKNRKRGNIYPRFWGKMPRITQIDLGSYVIRRDIFIKHAGDFGHRYSGDFDFIITLWHAGYHFFWYDRLVAKEQIMEPGLGRSESELNYARQGS